MLKAKTRKKNTYKQQVWVLYSSTSKKIIKSKQQQPFNWDNREANKTTEIKNEQEVNSSIYNLKFANKLNYIRFMISLNTKCFVFKKYIKQK